MRAANSRATPMPPRAGCTGWAPRSSMRCQDLMRVEVARGKELYAQEFSRGIPKGPVQKVGAAPNRRGTATTFHADAEIFGDLTFRPSRMLKMVRSRPICFPAWKSAGNRPSRMVTRQWRPISIFPAVWRITFLIRSEKQPHTQTAPLPERCCSPKNTTCPARSNGRSTGHPRATASSKATATRCPRLKVARMRRAFGPPS